MGFHPTPDKALIFAGDKMGNMGIFDASQTGPEVKDEDDEDSVSAPAITALKLHSRTITSFVFPADGNCVYSGSYDSSVRKFDLQKGVAVEAFAPPGDADVLPVSGIAIPSTDPNLLYSPLSSYMTILNIQVPRTSSYLLNLELQYTVASRYILTSHSPNVGDSGQGFL